MAQKTVSNFIELKNAIQDTTTTEILVTNNITFASGGISIPKTKGNITLDGNGYTITDYNSTGFTDTIYFGNIVGPDISFTVKNVIWNGKNYYGVVSAYDSANSNNVSIVLDTVTYTGPQLIFNRYGITRLKNCTVSIEQNGAPVASQELCEGNRIFIEGKVSVSSQTTANAVIWFPYAGSSFTVEANASFILNAPNTYMFYTDVAAKPPLIFKENSVTEITVRNGLFYASGADAHIASAFTLSNGASFKATSLISSGVPIFKCAGTFSAQTGSSFQLISPSAGSSPLMYFPSAASISFLSPKYVVLYNNGGKIFSFQSGSTASPNILNFTAEQINIWNTAKTPYTSAGGFTDTPTKAFYKAAYASEINATVQALPASIVSVANDLSAGDGGYPMNASTFNILTAKVISMGKLTLTPNNVTDISDSITGTANVSANIRAFFNGNTVTGMSASDGSFSLPLSARLPIDTLITVSSNKNFLTKNVTVTVTGSVSVTRLTELDFYTFAVPYHRSIVKRIDPNWYIEVTDTRKSGGDWYLYASLSVPLQSSANSLDGSLTFYENGKGQTLSTVPLLIKQGKWAAPPVVTRISWTEIEGLLLTVMPEKVYPGGKYTGKIKWEVTTEKL